MNVQPKTNNLRFSFSCCWNATSLELHPAEKHPRSLDLIFLIMNIIEVDFWMERVISLNNWEVPGIIYISSVCSVVYTKWCTDLRWALTEGHPIWKGGIFGTSWLSLRIEKNSINQGDFTTLTLHKTGWALRIYYNLIFYIKNSEPSYIQVHSVIFILC